MSCPGSELLAEGWGVGGGRLFQLGWAKKLPIPGVVGGEVPRIQGMSFGWAELSARERETETETSI